MQKLFHTIHLLASQLIIPFILLFAVSSFLIAHHIFERSPAEKASKEFFIAEPPSSITALQALLAEKHGIRGELTESNAIAGDKIELRLFRPGKSYAITLEQNNGRVIINSETRNFLVLLKDMHVTVGFPEDPALWWWGVSVLIVSILMLIITITGLLIWLKRGNEKRTGTKFLVVSLAYCGIVLTVLRFF